MPGLEACGHAVEGRSQGRHLITVVRFRQFHAFEPTLEDSIALQQRADHCRRIAEGLHADVDRSGVPRQCVAREILLAGSDETR